MRSLTPFALALLLATGCGHKKDYSVPAPPDAHVTIDFASGISAPAGDEGCPNTACGGCSAALNWDGSPSQPGDPCGFNGTFACTGTKLACSSSACLPCGSNPQGTICAADGHTILELTYPGGGGCTVYDFGSAIDVCNHGANDNCTQRCTMTSGVYHCVARCASDDGGSGGCPYQANATCESLAGC